MLSIARFVGVHVLCGLVEREPRHQQVCNRPDGEGVIHRAKPNGSTEDPAESEHHNLDTGANKPNGLVEAINQSSHEPVTGSWSEPAANVKRDGDAVQEDANGKFEETPPEVRRDGRDGQKQVDRDADDDDVHRRAEAELLAKWNPQQENDGANDDGDVAVADAGQVAQCLVEYAPWLKADAGLNHDCDRKAIHRQPDDDRDESSPERNWSGFREREDGAQDFHDVNQASVQV